jgi:hypothetical protein
MPQSLVSVTALVDQSQKRELELTNSLLGTLTAAERDRINAEIQAEQAKRVDLLDVMKQATDLQTSYSAQVDGAAAQQAATNKVLDEQIAHAKAALTAMDDDKNNKQKMVQINTFFGKQYAAYTHLAIIICVFLVALLIPNLVENLLHTPQIAALLRILIRWSGGLYIAYLVIDLIMRRNDNFDEYTWPVAPRTAVAMKTANETKGRFIDISGIDIPELCLGSYCCGPGTDWVDGSGCTILE